MFPRRLAAFFLWPGAVFRLEGAPLVVGAFVRRDVASFARDVVFARRRVRATSLVGDLAEFRSPRPPVRWIQTGGRPVSALGFHLLSWLLGRCVLFGARPLLGSFWLACALKYVCTFIHSFILSFMLLFLFY